jgi:hypothetical protein
MMQFPWMSPYVAFDNNPIYFVDPYGLEATNDGEGGGNPCSYGACDENGDIIDPSRDEGGNPTDYGVDPKTNSQPQAQQRGLIIQFEHPTSYLKDTQRRSAMNNDNSDVENVNFKTVMFSDIREGFEYAQKFAQSNKDVKNVIVFRGHGNKGELYFPIEGSNMSISQDDYNHYIVDFPNSEGAIAEFFKNFKSGLYKLNNLNTTLIFTNCYGGNSSKGLGYLLTENLKPGALILNQDKSEFSSGGNLSVSITASSVTNAQGFIIYKHTQIGDFEYYEEIKTGQGLMLNKSDQNLYKFINLITR